jgi:tetratricopeptide (TPR) repeat protein
VDEKLSLTLQPLTESDPLSMTLALSSAPTKTEPHQLALALCGVSKFAEAMALLRAVLDTRQSMAEPLLVETLNVAAAAALGLNQFADAENYWRESIAVKPDFVEAYNNLGILLKGLNRLLEAEEMFRRVVAIRPDQAQAYNNLGAVLYGLKRLHDAEMAYRQAIAVRFDYAEAHYNLGIVLYDHRRFAEAEAAYRQSLAVRPDCAEAHNNLGNVLRELGRLSEADEAYRQALKVRPQYPEALNNLGSVLKIFRRLPEAELACRLAVTLRPNYVEAHNNLASVLADLERFAEAEASYRQALKLHPGYAEAYYNLGIVLHKLERMAEAEAAYREALRINPAGVEAHNNLGSVLQVQERWEEAAVAYRQALALRPDLIEALYNLGNVLKELNRLSEAEASYRQALAVRADYPDAQFALATLLISMGQFEEGWRLYEFRYRKTDFIYRKTPSLLPCPQWQGESLVGKSLLVWQEDGLGDILQFSRYLPLLKARGAAHITVACLAPLRRLVAAVEGVDAVIDHQSAVDRALEFDCWTSLLSAPLHFRTTLDTIPPVDHPRPVESIVEPWRARLATLPAGHRIGLVWKGNPQHHNDANRSLPSLAALAPLWSVPHVQFVSVQKGQGEDEGRSPPAAQPLLHLGSETADLLDTAAIIAQLDLVIGVDTSVAHLAALMGKPCWIMLPSQGLDWRWMHGRSDSPWYPQTVRLFRRAADEEWAAVVERVREACAVEFAVPLVSEA